MQTKPLSKRQYPTKILTTQDMIKYFTEKEAWALVHEPTPELRPDKRKHPVQWTEVAKRAFAVDIIKFMLP